MTRPSNPVPMSPDPGSQGRSAFAALYRSQFDYVWTLLRRLGVEESSLDDAAQEVFLVVARRLDGFAGRAALRTWLFAIARRIAYRFRRTTARAARRHRALALRQVEPSPICLDARIERHQAARLLAEFLGRLDEGKRAAFILGELEGLGRVELGEALGLNPNTAYARLRAARELFEREFASSSARTTVLMVGREPEPAPSPRKHSVWILLTERLDGPAASPSGPRVPTTGGTQLLVGALVGAVLLALAAVSEPAAGVPASLAHSGRGRGQTDHGTPVVSVSTPDALVAAPVPAGPPPGPVVSAATVDTRVPGKLQAKRRRRNEPRRMESVETASTVVPSSSLMELMPVVRVEAASTFESRPALTAPTPAASGPTPPEPDAGSSLAEEIALLGTARRALAAGLAGEALSLLEQHAARFPESTLRPARAAMRITALCRRGDATRARAEASEFLTRYPTSGLTDQVRGSCSTTMITTARGGDQSGE